MACYAPNAVVDSSQCLENSVFMLNALHTLGTHSNSAKSKPTVHISNTKHCIRHIIFPFAAYFARAPYGVGYAYSRQSRKYGSAAVLLPQGQYARLGSPISLTLHTACPPGKRLTARNALLRALVLHLSQAPSLSQCPPRDKTCIAMRFLATSSIPNFLPSSTPSFQPSARNTSRIGSNASAIVTFSFERYFSIKSSKS